MLDTEVQELEVFVAVVKHGNFSKAAEELNIAASVVSRSIQKLEKKLKIRAFNRTTRRINLTQEGEWLYQQAINIIDKIENVERYLSKAQTVPQGTIRIDAATPFALHAIAPVIPGFKSQYNKINIILTSTESNIDLIDRNVDVAIRIGDLTDSSLKARKLGNSYRKVYASPDYLKEHGEPTKPDDLTLHTCLAFLRPEKLNTWPVLTKNGDWLKITPDIVADNGETLKQLAIQGGGLACISSFTAEQDVQAGNLVSVLEEYTQLVPIPINAVFYSDNETNLRLRTFLNYLVEHINLG